MKKEKWGARSRLCRSIVASVLLLAAVLGVLSGPQGTAHANGGPVYAPAEGFGPMRLEHSEAIVLVQEKVSYFIPVQTSVHQDPYPEATVEYELHNSSQEPQQVEVLFLYPSAEKLSVMEQGERPVPVTVVSDQELRGLIGRPTVRPAVIEPFSGKALTTRSSGQIIQGGRFALEFGAGETKAVAIGYLDPGGWEEKGVVNAVGSHLYYLSPAAYWAGEPKVELEVRLADESSRLSSNLPMTKEGPGVYRASLSKLPEVEWMFSHASAHRLLLPLNQQPLYNLIVLLIAGAGGILTAMLAIRWRRLWIAVAGALLWSGIVIGYITDMGGYPFQVILFPVLYVATASVQLALVLYAGRRMSRKRAAKDDSA